MGERRFIGLAWNCATVLAKRSFVRYNEESLRMH